MGLLLIGLYNSSTCSVKKYRSTDVIEQKYNDTKAKLYVSKALHQNIKNARRLSPNDIFKELEDEEDSIREKVESCLDEFDFEVICRLEEVTVLTGDGHEKETREIPAKIRSKRGEVVYRNSESELYGKEIVCSDQKKISSFLYNVKRAYGTGISNSISDPKFAQVLGLDEEKINQALSCINGYSNIIAYWLESGRSPTVDLEGEDLHNRIDLARKALEEFEERQINRITNIQPKEVILFELSRTHDSDEAIKVLREFDEKGEYLLHALTTLAFENKDNLPEVLNFIEDNGRNEIMFDVTAGNFLDKLLKISDGTYSVNDLEYSRELLVSIEQQWPN